MMTPAKKPPTTDNRRTPTHKHLLHIPLDLHKELEIEGALTPWIIEAMREKRARKQEILEALLAAASDVFADAMDDAAMNPEHQAGKALVTWQSLNKLNKAIKALKKG